MIRKHYILLGGPGSGKGTQAKLASKKLGIGHLSTGDKFRELWKSPTLSETEQKVKDIVDSGGYAPDDMTVALVKEWLQEPQFEKGAFMDGFPRTLPQVEAFEQMLTELDSTLAGVYFFKVSKEALYIRMTKRVTCSQCGTTYNTVTNPPKVEGVCDKCGGEFTHRKDQEEDAVNARFDIYFEKTTPIIDYYKNKGLLVEINGEKPIDTVQKEFLSHLIH